MEHMSVTLASIQAAADRIRSSVYRSPCPYSFALSRLCDATISCKFEHLQRTGSFKERGACNKLMQLTAEERARGVITASAGNHALGLAYHGQRLGIPVTVVMPQTAPLVKSTNCRSLGANTILLGENLEEARIHARALAAKDHSVYIHGFDDPEIIDGQGTIGLEIMEDHPDVDAVIVPVGGGGLIAGVAQAIKALAPHVRIIGVESDRASSLHTSLARGVVTSVTTKPTIADGLAVSEVGSLCFDIIRNTVDDVVLVDEAHIASAVLKMLELEKTVVEGSAAVPLAAMLSHDLGLRGKRVVLVLGGGNIDVTVLARIIERGLVMDGRLCRYVAHISDRPGSLARLLTCIAETGASIKEVTHDRRFGPADVAMSGVSIILETRDRHHISEVGQALRQAGFQARLDNNGE
jgi:threonine dehydratase